MRMLKQKTVFLLNYILKSGSIAADVRERFEKRYSSAWHDN